MECKVNRFGRQTGRTTAMLHRAIAEALGGKSVMIVVANHKSAMSMIEHTARMERPSEVNRLQMRLSYFRGSITFRVNDPHREHERGWSGPILTDHYALENL